MESLSQIVPESGLVLKDLELNGHYSHDDWCESANVIGVIREPFAREFR